MTAEGGAIAADELAELPVFPLPRVVLFPGAILPLHIFEPRYRAMMDDCVARGPLALAIAMLAPGWESDYEGRPAIHPVAGVGRIAEHRRRADGRWDLVLVGQLRARLTELPDAGLPYRRARAEPLADRISHEDAVERQTTSVLTLATSVATLVRESHPDFDLGIEPAMAPSALADRLADRLISDPDRRQSLLEATDVKVRLALVEDAMVELLAQIRGRDRSALH